MAFNVGIEPRCSERAVDHVALELGHIDAVGGKATHRLVERGRHVTHAEDEGGLDRLAAALGCLGLPRHHKKARGVVRRVLDVFGENVEPVDLRGEAARDGADALLAALGDLAGAAGSIAAIDGLQPMLADELPALPERHVERLHRLDVLERRALHSEQVHLDAQIMLAGDEEAGFGQQVVDVGDAAVERIFDRHDAMVGLAAFDGGERILEGRARHRFAARKQRMRGGMAESAGFALKGDEFGHVASPGFGAPMNPQRAGKSTARDGLGLLSQRG